jgi:hypothetical protein
MGQLVTHAAFHTALANYSRAASAAATSGHHHAALEATEDMAAALEVLARCAGGMSAGAGAGGGSSDEAAAAALAAVTVGPLSLAHNPPLYFLQPHLSCFKASLLPLKRPRESPQLSRLYTASSEANTYEHGVSPLSTSLLDAAPGLVQASYASMSTSAGGGVMEDGDGTSLVATAAARIAPAVYAAVGACAPWAARWLAAGGGGQGQGRAFLSAVLRAILAPLRNVNNNNSNNGSNGNGHNGNGQNGNVLGSNLGGGGGGGGGDLRALAPAAGALAAVLSVARPSPPDLLALPETGEALSIVPALVLSGKLPAGGGGGDCLAALGAALLRRAPGEATVGGC